MKKLGTPSGAAPGAANEKVGLAGVGTPLVFFLPLLVFFLDFGFLLLLLPPEPFLEPLPLFWFPGWVCEDGFCVLAGLEGCGGVCVDVVEVDVEVEVVVEVEVELELELELVLD